MKDQSTDFIVSYYVFEHLIELPTVIAECYRVLKDNGTLVIEVPDIGYYTHLLDAIGFHEHVNHFSIRTLCRLLAQNGFRLKEFSRKYASRHFGMVAAFTKCPEVSVLYCSEIESNDAIALLVSGRELMIEADCRIAKFREQILDWSTKGDRMIFWVANTVTQDVIGQVQIPGNHVLVDIDPNKNDFVDGHRAFLPTERVEDIKAANRIIIFTEIHAPNIVLHLRSLLRDCFSKVSITVFSPSSGSQDFSPKF